MSRKRKIKKLQQYTAPDYPPAFLDALTYTAAATLYKDGDDIDDNDLAFNILIHDIITLYEIRLMAVGNYDLITNLYNKTLRHTVSEITQNIAKLGGKFYSHHNLSF